jgi:hypothetical protein
LRHDRTGATGLFEIFAESDAFALRCEWADLDPVDRHGAEQDPADQRFTAPELTGVSLLQRTKRRLGL